MENKLIQVSDKGVSLLPISYPLLTIHESGYTIFKITPDRNIRNYNNLVIINALSELYSPLSHRISRERTIIKLPIIPVNISIPKPKWTYNRLSRLYFDVVYSKDEITFYISVPNEYKNLIEQKITQAWEHSAVETVDKIPIQKSSVSLMAKLEYRRHNMLALRTDRDDNDPMTDQLTIIDHMGEDDMARINMCLEPVNHRDWISDCEEAYDLVKKGQMPRRKYESLKDPKTIAWKSLELILRTIANTLLEFLTDKGTEYTPPRDPQLEIILSGGKLSNSTLHKIGSKSLKSEINILSMSNSLDKSDTMLRTLCNSYKTLSEDNELSYRIIKTNIDKRIENINKHTRITTKDPIILSDKEAAKLIQLPTAGLQDKYPIPSISTREFNIPDIILDPSKGVPFGYYSIKCKDHVANIPVSDHDELCLPTVVVAGMGQGKTKGFASNYALEMFLKGYSVIAVDVAKGEIMEQILNTLPKRYRDKVVYLDLSNPDYPIPLDWSEVTLYNTRTASQRLTDELSHFLKSTSDPAGDRTRMYLEIAAKTVFSIPGKTILDIVLILKSDEYRYQLLKEIKDPGLIAQWDDWDNLTEAQQREFYRPILFRLNTIMGNQLLKNCICQEPKLDSNGEPLINFRKWMDDGYLVLIKAKKSSLLEQGLNDIMSFITAKVWLSALTRDEDKEDYKPCIYILDEPQQYLSGSANHFAQMFTESRKWRLKLVFLFHSWAQLKEKDKDLARILRSALCHWHIYSTSEEELKDMKTYIKPYSIDEALAIKRHWAINHMRVNGDYHTFITKMIPPPVDRLPRANNSDIPERDSKYYGTWYEDVENNLQSKERILISSLPKSKKSR